MGRWGRRCWPALLLAALPLFGQAEEALVICFESEDVRPWRHKDGSGLNFELLNRVARRANVTFRYEPAPWRRCFSEMHKGAVSGVLGASFKPERMEFGAYPGGNPADARRSVYSERYLLVRRKGDKVDWDGSAIRHLDGPVAVQNGYSVGGDLRAINVGIDDGARSAADNLNKLLAGRVGAVAILAGEFSSLLGKEPALRDKVEALPRPLVEKPYYLILSHQLLKTRPEVAERIWSQIEAVRQSKEYLGMEAQALGKRSE